MEIDSKYAGTGIREFNTVISQRQMMNYAASIKDMNPVYFNDESKTGVIAHPMLAVGITWPITGNIQDFIEINDFPKEVLMTQVHYSEHLTFHQPIKPDDHLNIKGKIAAILPHRAGTTIVLRYDAKTADGEPVFTEHIGAILRGVQCRNNGKGESSLPQTPKPVTEQSPLWESKIHIGAEAPFIYDGCTDIFFPIHTSIKFARQVGLPGIILQGTATLALAVSEIINKELNGNPLLLKSLSCRFSGMVKPESNINIRLTGKDQDNGLCLFFTVFNEKNEKVISHGYVELDTQGIGQTNF